MTARIRTTKTATFHGWKGTGRTAAEAKAAAIAACEAAAEGSYAPQFITHRGVSAVVFRLPSGWSYLIVGTTETATVRPACYSHLTDSSYGAAVRAAAAHLAQTTAVIGETEAPPFVTHQEDRAELASWMRWQNAYAAHKAAHPDASDHECRAAAALETTGHYPPGHAA